MKNGKLSIKKQIKSKIILSKQVNVMNDRDKLRIGGTPPIHINSANRNIIRRGEKEIVLEKHKPISVNDEQFSIIVTAYKTQEFIEECLDSINNQSYFTKNCEYEILIGVDDCKDTLNKLMKIRDKYKNLRIFMMKKNSGTYITSNTLLKLVKYNNIIRFDSDDVMKSELINEIMYLINDFDVIRLKYINFVNSIDIPKSGVDYANGAIFFKKNIIKMFGGYQPWKCAADHELIRRMTNYVNIGKTDDVVFYLRIHNNALTKSSETGMKSEYRKKLLGEIKNEYSLNEIKIRRVIGDYFEV